VSNICSLACRSCNEGSSSTYAKIAKNTSNSYLEKDITEISDYWDAITNTITEKFNSHTQFYIHLMGGEPLIHAGGRKILNWLIDQGYASKTNIRITTSLNVELKKDLLEIFSKFQMVQFILSIDSVGENYHYVRWPAKFSKIEHNLSTLMLTQQFNKRSTNYKHLILSPVFSLNNIFYLKDYLDFWYNWSKENDYCMFFLHTNLVEQTKHLDIEALPVKYRSMLIDILKECSSHIIISEYPDHMQHLHYFIQTTIDELNHRADDPALWDEFLNYTAEFDIRTNTQFENFNDRLYNLLDDNDKKSFNAKLSAVNPATTLLHWHYK
jgi:organic radical activating enzyme